MYQNVCITHFIQICIYPIHLIHMTLMWFRYEASNFHDMCTDFKSTQGNSLLQGTNKGLIFMGILIIQKLLCVKLWMINFF